MNTESGYLIYYLVTFAPDSIPVFFKLLSTDPAMFFDGADALIVGHIIDNNGLARWGTFLKQNPDVDARYKQIRELVVNDDTLDFSESCVEEWVGGIRKDYDRGQTAKLLKEAQKLLKDGQHEQALSLMQMKSTRILSGAYVHQVGSPARTAHETQDMIADLRQGGQGTFAKTFVPWFDRRYTLQRGTVNGIIGASGAAKTALCGQLSYTAGEYGQVSLWIQAEMLRSEMGLREAIRRTRNPSWDNLEHHAWAVDEYRRLEDMLEGADFQEAADINNQLAELSKQMVPDEAWDAIDAKAGELEKYPVYIDDETRPTAVQILAKMREVKREAGRLDFVFIDTLGGMASMDKGMSRNDGNWFKWTLQEVKDFIPRSFPETAIVCLQHTNAGLMQAKSVNQDDKRIIPDAGDIEGNTNGRYHRSLIVTRPVLHKKQLQGVFGESAWDALTDIQRREWLESCYLTPTKGRNNNLQGQYSVRYIGRWFSFEEWGR